MNEFNIKWADDYLDIQMVQSRLTIFTDSLMMDKIPEMLFAREGAQILLPETGLFIEGYDRMNAWYSQLKQDTIANGGTLGTNQSTSQWIEIDSDRGEAVGQWMTYNVELNGPAKGKVRPPYLYHTRLGRYENTFIKEDGSWRIRTLKWQPVMDLETYDCVPPSPPFTHKSLDYWPKPYALYEHHMEDELKPDLYCMDVLQIQNLHGKFVHWWNSGQYMRIYDELFDHESEDISFFDQGLPQVVHGQDNVHKIFRRYEDMAGCREGLLGIQLATSRVIEVQPDGQEAVGTWTSWTLDTVENDGNNYRLNNRTGRWYIGFIKKNGVWKYKNYTWLVFATMSVIEGRRVL